MATDNVIPIGPHAALPSPEEIEARCVAADMAARVFNARAEIFQAMGVIHCAEMAVADDDVAMNEADIRQALKAAYCMLNEVCAELDPSYFEQPVRAEEVAHGQ